MKAILDTSVLVATHVGELEGQLAISAASLAELHFGVLVTTDAAIRAERLRRLTVLQRSFDALSVDDEVAARYGQLAAAVVAKGRQPRSRVIDPTPHSQGSAAHPGRAGVIDLLIAATALAHDARLYTRNAADLVGIEHLVDIVSV